MRHNLGPLLGRESGFKVKEMIRHRLTGWRYVMNRREDDNKGEWGKGPPALPYCPPSPEDISRKKGKVRAVQGDGMMGWGMGMMRLVDGQG